MGRIVTAHVEMADGRDFVAEIANLTPHSLFIHTSEQLSFRAPVTVTFFSVSFRAELAIVTQKPAGWVVVFDADSETRARIEARIPEVNVLTPPLAPSLSLPPMVSLDEATMRGASSTPTGDEIRRALASLEPNSLREALQSTGGIPSAITGARGPMETVELEDDPDAALFERTLEPISEISPQELLAALPEEEPTGQDSRTMPAVELPRFEEQTPSEKPGGRPRAIPHARTVRMRPTPAPLRSGVPVRTPRRRDLTRREVREDSTAIDMPAIDGAMLEDIPELADDGSTVLFASAPQYLLQHKTNIAHGAIVVRSLPMPIGIEKTLHLSVPGVKDAYTLKARVILSTEDSITFSIEELDRHASQLAALVR